MLLMLMIRPNRADHPGADRPGEEERPLEVRVDDVVPGLVFHAEHQAVASDSGIVDQDIDPLEFRLNFVDDPLDVGRIGDIGGITVGGPPGVSDGLEGRFQPVEAACHARDRRPARRQSDRDRLADATRCTRDQRDPPRQIDATPRRDSSLSIGHDRHTFSLAPSGLQSRRMRL